MTMPLSVRLVATAICALTVIAAGSRSTAQPAPKTPAPPAAATAPKLVVVLVVDQMRGSYLQQHRSRFSAGFARLTRDGAWFIRGAYPYLNTVTCAGHATIGTGSMPYRHGMILNAWLDRSTGDSPYCTDDPTKTEISYNGLKSVGSDSAARMLAPAIGEQVMARGGRSVVFSLKPRSAVTLTGRTATAIAWFDDRGGWATSSSYSNGPVPFLKTFIDANPITADFDKVWERTLPPAQYEYSDDAVGEGTVVDGGRMFPHRLGLKGGKPDAGFYARWQRSPFADEYLARMAMAAVDAEKLGQGSAVDFLGVSFSSLDFVGHLYGPRSHEVQDMLVRLDRTIGRLLDHLDERVGAGNYVVGLSADHGVADVPEQIGRGGRVASQQVIDAVQGAIAARIGLGKHVITTQYTDVYLSPPAAAAVASDAALRGAIGAALRAVPSIVGVFFGAELASEAARRSPDRLLRAAALSYHPERSGEVIIVPGRHWMFSTAVATHGTHYDYDQQVPVLLFGAGVRGGLYSQAATPADLVPSLAAIAGIPIAPADGRVLSEAVRPASPTAKPTPAGKRAPAVQ